MLKTQNKTDPLNDGKTPIPIVPVTRPKEAEELSQFRPIHQGTATNVLTKIKPLSGGNIELDLLGNATIREHNMTLLIKEFNVSTNSLKISTNKLLDALTISLTENSSQSSLISLSLDEFMSNCGLKDKRKARAQIKADMETLSRLKISWREKRDGKPKDFLDVFVFGGERGIRNGIIYFSFSQTFFEILKSYPVMPYHRALLQINPQYNPNSYNIGRKMLEHKQMNAGKKNENRIAVASLLKICPDIPSHSKVRDTNREFTGRIIKPFERDLDALEKLLAWEYCHRNGTPLTEDELKKFSYDAFIKCLVNIYWVEYPDQSRLIEAKAADVTNTSRKKHKKGTASKRETLRCV
jgi:hypothetical protein